MTAPPYYVNAATYEEGDTHVNVTSFRDFRVHRKEPKASLLRKTYDLWAVFNDGQPPRMERFNPYELTNAYRLVVEINTTSPNPFDYAILRGGGSLRSLRNISDIGHKRWHYNTLLEVREERRPVYEDVEELTLSGDTEAYYKRVILPVVDDTDTVVKIYIIHRPLIGTPALIREAHD